MAKMLKPLVLVILLLSAVALTLGILLFAKREVLKGRTQRLEGTAMKIAKNLNYSKLTANQLKANNKAELAALDKPLSDLAVQAEIVYSDLQTNKQELAETKSVLAKTREELNTAKAELVTAQNKIAELNETVTKKDAEITEKAAKIAQLETDKTGLQGQVDSLTKKITKLEASLTEANQVINERDKENKYLRAQLGEKFPIPKGLKGNILAVNPTWNFVVLDIGLDNGLLPSVEMMVHRDNELIGKVRIGMVLRHVAIADIVTADLKPNIVLQEGDHVLY